MKVGCAGIIVSDTICGPMQELPGEGQLLAVDELPTKVGGCAANVAIDLAKQNLSVDIAGCLGNDAYAQVLLTSLQKYDIDTSQIVYSDDMPTSKTVILLVAGQDRRFIHSFGANAAFTVGHINRDWVSSLQVFYVGGLFLMPAFRPEELVDLLLFCRQHGVITVLDVVIPQNAVVSGDLGKLLSAADFFLPNDDEAQILTGFTDPQDQLRALIRAGANQVVITLGHRGILAGQGNQTWQAGIYKMPEVKDPSGCGDAFDAGMITGIVHGWDMATMLRYASALGASAVRALGTTDGVFTAEEARSFLSSSRLEIKEGRL